MKKTLQEILDKNEAKQFKRQKKIREIDNLKKVDDIKAYLKNNIN